LFFFTVLSFNQRSPPPEFLSARRHLERTHSITSVLACHGISFFALMKTVVSTVETLASFLTYFYVFSASRAWLKFVCTWVVWQAPQCMKLLGNLTIWRAVVDWCLTGSFLQLLLGHCSVQFGYQREQNYTEIVLKHVF